MFSYLHPICPLVLDLTRLARETNIEELEIDDATRLIWDFLFSSNEYSDPISIGIKERLEENFTAPLYSRQKRYAQYVIIKKMFYFLLMNED